MAQPKQPPIPRMSGAPHNPGLRKLIAAKREGHFQPDRESLRRGFQGWHARGYLPHFDAPGVTQFITFMLADSFPVERHAEWEPILRLPSNSLRRRQLEAWLDRGHGECWLRKPTVAECVEQALRAKDGQDYCLRAWTIMPNHVHLVVEVWQTPLSRLLNLWKGSSSYEANGLLKRRGRFWEKESFDTLIRDAAHLGRALRYTENNPVKAGFVRDARDWPWTSARWRDDFGHLPWQKD